MLVYRSLHAECCIASSCGGRFIPPPGQMSIAEIGATFAFDPRSYVRSMWDR